MIIHPQHFGPLTDKGRKIIAELLARAIANNFIIAV